MAKRKNKYKPLTLEKKQLIISIFFSKNNNSCTAIAIDVDEPVSRVNAVIDEYFKTINSKI